MRRSAAIILLFFVSGLIPMAAQDAQPIPLPSSRIMANVEASERNPFAKPEVPKVEIAVSETDKKSEEARIEAVLQGLTVVGRTRGPNGWKVLLGDLILEQGKILPHVIDGQTNTLRVANIAESVIEIEWVSNDTREIPRRLFITVNLKPAVNSALGGRKSSTSSKTQPTVVTPPLTPPTQ